jgi:hypothetical protein
MKRRRGRIAELLATLIVIGMWVGSSSAMRPRRRFMEDSRWGDGVPEI